MSYPFAPGGGAIHEGQSQAAAATAATNVQDDAVVPDLIGLTKKLLNAIAARDYPTYQELVDDSVTAFEPEAVGNLVEGLEFHKYYFQQPLTAPHVPQHTVLIHPHQRMLGPDAGMVTYVRLTQTPANAQTTQGTTNTCSTTTHQETRIWKRHDNGKWKNVHFHRSQS